MFLETFRRRLKPFNQTYKSAKIEDFFSYRDLTPEIQTTPFLSKTIVADDILGYCEVHDIDLNIYRYFYTVPATPDFFDSINVLPNSNKEWNLILNGQSVNYLDIESNPDCPKMTFETIDNPYFINIEDDGTPTLDSEGLIPLLKGDKELYNDVEKHSVAFKAIKSYLMKYTNLKRYGKSIEEQRLRELKLDKNADILAYDDDITTIKEFYEDEKYLLKSSRYIWPYFRFAIIHNQFYIFTINKDDLKDGISSIKSLIIAKPEDDRARLHFGNSPKEKDVVQISLEINQDGIKTVKRYTDSSLRIYSKYIRIPVGKSLEEVIIDKIKERYDEDEWFDYFDEDTNTLPEITKLSFFHNFTIDSIIHYSNEEDITGIKMWDLDQPRAELDDIIVLYKGSIDMDTWIDNLSELFSIDETHYRDEISSFNRLTKGRCKHLIPDINEAINMPEGWQSYDEDKLQRVALENDYDLFMSLNKSVTPINVRVNLEKCSTHKETQQGLIHTDIPYVEEEANSFIKIVVPNFHRMPFDLYIGNVLYTGPIEIEREHHYDLIYISMLQLYKFLHTHNLGKFASNVPVDERVIEYV